MQPIERKARPKPAHLLRAYDSMKRMVFAWSERVKLPAIVGSSGHGVNR